MKKYKWYSHPALPTLLILSIVALVRFRRHGSPILSAIKVVNLTAAMVALLSLEATMLQRFGDVDDWIFRGTMIGISGLVASLILLSMSVYMIIHASKKLSKWEETTMSENFEYTYSAETQSEIEAIRKKYLPREEQENKLEQLRKLDASVGTKALIASMALGILSALVFGVGMCCFLVWSLWALGGLLCVVGVIGMLVAPWLYRKLVEKRKAEIAPEILRLTEELSQK